MTKVKNAVYAILRAIKQIIVALTFREQRRAKINEKDRKRLRNKEFSLISSNCNGGVMCHDLGLPFRTQFVNLWLWPKDFIKYLNNLDYYNSIDEIRFLPPDMRRGHQYPIGFVDDLEVHFTHYKSDEEALIKWNERKRRMNKDNIFVMMSEQNNCTMEDLIEFDKLPYKNKVVFTKQPYPNIKSGFYISGFETKKEIGTVLAFKNVFSAKRFYDCFPYVDWFNGDYRVEQDTTNENTIHSV